MVVVPSSQGATLSDRYPSAIRGAVGFYDRVEVSSSHGYGGSARSLTTPSVPNNALLLLIPVHICCHFNLENLFRFCSSIKTSDARRWARQVHEGSMRDPLDGHSLAVTVAVDENIKPDNDVAHRVAPSLISL